MRNILGEVVEVRDKVKELIDDLLSDIGDKEHGSEEAKIISFRITELETAVLKPIRDIELKIRYFCKGQWAGTQWDRQGEE